MKKNITKLKQKIICASQSELDDRCFWNVCVDIFNEALLSDKALGFDDKVLINLIELVKEKVRKVDYENKSFLQKIFLLCSENDKVVVLKSLLSISNKDLLFLSNIDQEAEKIICNHAAKISNVEILSMFPNRVLQQVICEYETSSFDSIIKILSKRKKLEDTFLYAVKRKSVDKWSLLSHEHTFYTRSFVEKVISKLVMQVNEQTICQALSEYDIKSYPLYAFLLKSLSKRENQKKFLLKAIGCFYDFDLYHFMRYMGSNYGYGDCLDASDEDIDNWLYVGNNLLEYFKDIRSKSRIFSREWRRAFKITMLLKKFILVKKTPHIFLLSLFAFLAAMYVPVLAIKFVDDSYFQHDPAVVLFLIGTSGILGMYALLKYRS